MYEDGSDLDAQRATAISVAKKHGIEGGISVFHHVRTDKYDGPGSSDGTVHFHIIGLDFYGIAPGGTDYDGAGDPVIFKHIKDEEYSRPDLRDWGGFRSERAVKRATQYLLTHCGIVEGKHALTYFGTLSYNKMSRPRIESMFSSALKDDNEDGPECPVCGSRDPEPCTQSEPTYQWGDLDHSRPIGVHEVHAYPEPDWNPGDKGPWELLWTALKDELTHDALGEDRRWQGQTRHALSKHIRMTEEQEQIMDRIIELNLESGRLIERGEHILLAPPKFDIDGALLQMKWMHFNGVPVSNGDPELVALIRKAESERKDHGDISDTEFVFGTLMERYRGRSGVTD